MHIYDVIVIGGGPAGSTVARLLASWARSVVVLSKPSPSSRLGLALGSCATSSGEERRGSLSRSSRLRLSLGSCVTSYGEERKGSPSRSSLDISGERRGSPSRSSLDISGERRLAESLPPSIRKLLRFLGALEAVDAAGFYRTSGNTAWWQDPRGTVENFSVDPGSTAEWGYQVPRGDLDRVLLELAEVAGAEVRPQVVAIRVDLTDPERARVLCRPAGADGPARTAPTFTVEGRFVVDCTGRAGIVARTGLRAREPGDATLALVGVWRSAGGWPLADETHTLVEAYPDGWAWSIPVSRTVRYCTFMVDWRETALVRGRGLEATYRAELAKTERFRAIFGTGVGILQGPPWSCDASLYSARAYGGRGFLLVGDAGSFIDPLSSFGVKKALASAWIGAVTINTCLANPAMRAPALEFFSNRERQVYASYLRQRAHHVREVARRYPHPFWIRRSGPTIETALWDPDEEELKRDAEVLAAFSALREAPSITLRLAEGARVGEGVGVADRELVMEERLIGPGIPSGVRFLGGVNLPELVRIAGIHRQVPDLYSAYNRIAPPVALPDFLGALSTLLAKGVLRNES